jgi:hypothetical protein
LNNKSNTYAGSIFSNLDRLTAPLNQLDHLSIPPHLTNQSTNQNFTETTSKGLSTSIGLNATILRGIAGSTSAIYAFTKDKSSVYACDLLETLEFEPDKQFVTDAITASQSVQSFLENSLPGRKRVYMITGLKIATGFRTSTSSSSQHGPSLSAGVDALALTGVPIEAGPEFEIECTRGRTVEQGRALNKVVFAYRVVRIRRKRDGEARFRYKSGGKYAMGDSEGESEDEDGPWEVEAMEEETRLGEFPDSVPVSVEAAPKVEGQDASECKMLSSMQH